MTQLADLPLWPDTVTDFYADRACTIRSAATRKIWGYTYRSLQAKHPGTPITAFTTDDLVAYVTQRGWAGPRWATNTARSYRTALCSLFGWAHDAGRITTDPARRLARLAPIRRVPVRRPHWLTADQAVAIVHAADHRGGLAGGRLKTIVLLGLLAGLRTSELHKLRWADVDVGGGFIHLTGKGEKVASIAIAPQLGEHLTQWQRICDTDAETFTGAERSPVLPQLDRHRRGTFRVSAGRRLPITVEGIRREVHGVGGAVGLPDLRPHDLRRSLAGLLDQRGVPVQDIRAILRHDTLAATQAYLGDNPLRVARRITDFRLDL